MKRLLMTLIVVSVFMATSAHAAAGKMYFAGSAAFSIPMDIDVDVDEEVSFDPGFNITGAVGYDLGVYRVEGEIGYRAFDVDEFTISGVPIPIDGDVSAITFMANGYYDYDMGNSPLTPYVGLGLGLVYSDVELNSPLGTFSDDDIDGAYQVMVGIGYEISPTTVLTAGYRFFGIMESDPLMIHDFSVGARFMF